MTHLLLDAAFPPSPQQWVADMNAVGADGGFVYVYGPFTNYTPQHVVMARQVGKVVLPIIVPGNTWPSFATLLMACQRYGFQSGPVVGDLEPGSLPPNTDMVNFAMFMQQRGYQFDRYGTQSILGAYAPEGEDWIADWIRQGQLLPLPPLPQGWQSWQFVDDVVINGSTYDASIVSDSFIMGATQEIMDPKDPIVQEFRYALARVVYLLSNGKELAASFDQAGTPAYTEQPDWPNWLAAQFNADQAATAAIVNDVKTAITNLQVPPADLQPVTDSLAKLSAHLGVGTA